MDLCKTEEKLLVTPLPVTSYDSKFSGGFAPDLQTAEGLPALPQINPALLQNYWPSLSAYN